MPDKTSIHAIHSLAAIDPRSSVVQHAENVCAQLKTNAALAEAWSELDASVRQFSVKKETVELIEKLEGNDHRLSVDIPEVSKANGLLMVLGHATANARRGELLQLLNTSNIVEHVRSSKKRLDALLTAEPDFFDELIIQALLRATKEPSFAAVLQSEADEITQLVPRFKSLSEDISKSSSSKVDPKAAPGWVHDVIDWIWDTVSDLCT